MDKPAVMTDEHLVYLDELRVSGVVSMYGAGSHLRDDYPELTKSESWAILGYWMATYDDRHPAQK